MSAAQPQILLVEDEPAQREILAYNLESEGFDVRRAENGEEAILLVAEALPDLIILDWMMPLLSGIEVCRQLKTREDTRNIPVIMLSARSEEVDTVRGLETGRMITSSNPIPCASSWPVCAPNCAVCARHPRARRSAMPISRWTRNATA